MNDKWKALVEKAVSVLQRNAPPGGLSDFQALSELYGIFDGPEYRAALEAARATPAQPVPTIDEMVNRFLGWKLPKNFSPDNGIAFYPPENPEFWAIGTNLFTADQAKAMFEYCLLAQPLQQEGRKDERAAFEEWHAERWGRPIRLGQTDQYKMDSSQGKWLAWQARAALLQPSDNLQQASTAQVEPARQKWITCPHCKGDHGGCGSDGVENDCPKCEDGMVRVASAFRTELTDAELSDPEFTRAYIEGCNESFAEAMDEIKTLRAAISAPSQATPEGGQDLPPLPTNMWYPGMTEKHFELAMTRYAHAAIAATTAAEPQQPDYSANSDHRIMQVDDNGRPM